VEDLGKSALMSRAQEFGIRLAGPVVFFITSMSFVSFEGEKSPMAQKKVRGFAAMSPEQQREIASKGGRAAHQRGTAHEWDSSEAAAAGRKGGRAAHHRNGTINLASAARAQQADSAMNPQEARDTQENTAGTAAFNRQSGETDRNPDIDTQAFEVEDSGNRYQFNQSDTGTGLTDNASEQPSRR
jgi:general stress protein YciG